MIIGDDVAFLVYNEAGAEAALLAVARAGLAASEEIVKEGRKLEERLYDPLSR
jgi:hypothetical protein